MKPKITVQDIPKVVDQYKRAGAFDLPEVRKAMLPHFAKDIGRAQTTAARYFHK